jgi:hypothetical protein
MASGTYFWLNEVGKIGNKNIYMTKKWDVIFILSGKFIVISIFGHKNIRSCNFKSSIKPPVYVYPIGVPL